MPTGYPDSLSPVARLIEWLQPARVLDVGVGGGRMGFLAREYGHHPWHPRAHGGGVEVHGIEGYEPYLGPVQRAVYDRLEIGDALDVLPRLKAEGERYELVIASDILEHFDDENARLLLERCLAVGDLLLIVTPSEWFAQTSEENDLETHRSHWDEDALRAAGAHAVLHRGESVVALFGDAALAGEYAARLRRPLRRRLTDLVRT